MSRAISADFLLLCALLLVAGQAEAAALTAPAVGCRTFDVAVKAASFKAKHDNAGYDGLTRPLLASGTCIPLAKGVVVDIDESRPPLDCIRLSGDLSCYWVPATLVDQHPGEKGSAGASRKSGHKH